MRRLEGWKDEGTKRGRERSTVLVSRKVHNIQRRSDADVLTVEWTSGSYSFGSVHWRMRRRSLSFVCIKCIGWFVATAGHWEYLQPHNLLHISMRDEAQSITQSMNNMSPKEFLILGRNCKKSLSGIPNNKVTNGDDKKRPDKKKGLIFSSETDTKTNLSSSDADGINQ